MQKYFEKFEIFHFLKSLMISCNTYYFLAKIRDMRAFKTGEPMSVIKKKSFSCMQISYFYAFVKQIIVYAKCSLSKPEYNAHDEYLF